jgi:hypothetical protein
MFWSTDVDYKQVRFFNEKLDVSNVKTFSSEQILSRINLSEEKVNKLCLVKGKEGFPLQALSILSELKKEVTLIIQGVPAPKVEDTLQVKSKLVSSI